MDLTEPFFIGVAQQDSNLQPTEEKSSGWLTPHDTNDLAVYGKQLVDAG
jgi:hypothetical protein